MSGDRCHMSDVRPKCEKLQMAITQQCVIRSTSRLVPGWVFLASTDYIALFNLTAHELHELNYDRPTSQRGIGQTPCSFEHVSCWQNKQHDSIVRYVCDLIPYWITTFPPEKFLNLFFTFLMHNFQVPVCL